MLFDFKNLSNKKKRNKFSKSLAVKAFMYLVDDGAKRYTREFGGNPKDIFPKFKRTELAKEYVDEFEGILRNPSFTVLGNAIMCVLVISAAGGAPVQILIFPYAGF